METIFTTSEKEMLVMLLQKEERTLHIEINHTSHRDFKLQLKERLAMITTMLDKLKVNEPSKVF